MSVPKPTSITTCAPCPGYTTLLNWTFIFFSSTRLLTYLPTLWAIHASGNSSQPRCAPLG